ncbi:hypothetical protein RclHR1_00160004 [Rhizophagus clarus]|uniref:SAM domain-containing protein n=1 Tax=Rhizophagus clarus TaxID=94130 RepID=A0A2Z6R9B1_9GLOM|nr:hypothetical protein RclHR1_00160004 [Rhizophagus clarus]
MADKAPNNIQEWSPKHVRNYLEKHMNGSDFKEDDINKLQDQDVNGWFFLRLTEEKLTRRNDPYELKPGPAERIMELVERLKEKQEAPPVSVEVVTALEFEKYRESNGKELKKIHSDIDTAKADIDGLYDCLSRNLNITFTTNINYYREAHLIKNKLELPKEELGDELLEEPHELVSDSLVELASDSLDTLCWSKSDL